MERIKNIYEVTQRLTGMIDPIGETEADAVRLINLHQTIDLTYQLINDIVGVAENRTSLQGSMKTAGLKADNFLKALKEQLEYY